MKPVNSKQLNQVLQNLQAQTQKAPIWKTADNAPWLGLDYGSKVCGLAFSPDGIIITPIGTKTTSDIEDEINKIHKEKKIKSLIIGLPVSNNQNTDDTMADWVRKSTKKLANNYQVYYINERGSSQNTIISSKKKKQNQRIDDLAAVNILEYYQAEQHFRKSSC